jgi:hypothetical protein
MLSFEIDPLFGKVPFLGAISAPQTGAHTVVVERIRERLKDPHPVRVDPKQATPCHDLLVMLDPIRTTLRTNRHHATSFAIRLQSVSLRELRP